MSKKTIRRNRKNKSNKRSNKRTSNKRTSNKRTSNKRLTKKQPDKIFVDTQHHVFGNIVPGLRNYKGKM